MERPDARERLIAIGEIAAEVAHELRNALQNISANAFLAKQAPAESLAFLDKIEKSARIAHGIVDDLMALARGEPAHTEPIVFADVLLAARAMLPAAGVGFEDRLEPRGLTVRAHQGLLARLFHVLYENAVAASAPRPPKIVTHARSENGRIVVDVADDGPGIPAAVADSVFEPLVSARPGGTGLGLALARRVVAAHGGSIALVSTDTGATFRIELPVA